MMIRLLFILVFLSSMVGCSQKNSYDPDKHLSMDQKQKMLNTIIRYIAEAPKNVKDSLKFESKYDNYYAEQVSKHNLMAYFIDDNENHYFLISRKAPSIHEKWVATGGKMRFDKENALIYYEEVFRTWKLLDTEIQERAPYLFDLMIKGEDLTPYYTATSGFNYIEFPDSKVYYDSESRAWKVKN